MIGCFASNLRSVGLSIVLTAFIAGCGGGETDGFKGARGQVTGTLKYNGKAAPAGSSVLFQSKDAAGYMAAGTVGPDGKYELLYKGKKDLPATDYLVTVTPPAASAAAPASTDPTAMADGAKLAEASATAQGVIPKKYLTVASTDWLVTVKAGPNTVDYELKD